MKLFLIITIITSILAIGCKKEKDDSKQRNLLLGAVVLANQTPSVESLNFKAILNNHEVECGSHTYTLPGTQVVQIKDFRFFVEDIQFVRADGSKVPFKFTNVDEYQAVEGDKQVALLDFVATPQGGSGACTGNSDNDKTHRTIKGTAPGGTYKGVEITIGVPQSMNHQDPSQRPATHPLRSGTGLQWNWQAGYKFMKIELAISNNGTPTNDIFRLHLGSTNCTGTVPNVTCANSYRPTLVLEPNGGFDPAKDVIVFDGDELFKQNGGVPTSAFGTGTSLSCMPIGNGAGTGGTPVTCGPILKNLGLNPGTQAGFSNTLVTETGVGTVNPITRQPILKVLRDLDIHGHDH